MFRSNLARIIVAAAIVLRVGEIYAQNADVQMLLLTLTNNPAPAVKAKPTEDDVKACAAQLMLIKNGMGLYRDGAMDQAATSKLRALVNRHLAVSGRAISRLGADSRQKLAHLVFENALHVYWILSLPVGGEEYKVAMEKYHVTTGYDAYTEAQDLGIEQVWGE